MKIAGITVICGLFLLMLYVLVCMPIYQLDLNLENKRNYFIIAGVSLASTFTYVGLTLGWFYYFHKYEFDKEVLTNEKKEQMRRHMLELINKYDDAVDLVLNRKFENDEELKYLRNQIRKRNDDVTMVIDSLQRIKGISDNSTKLILILNSYVDNSNLLSEATYTEIREADIQEVIDDYNDLLHHAKSACYM